MITVTYRALDGFRQTRRFKTLSGACRFARSRIGETPELGGSYAVSGDGVGRITVNGASLAELFPQSGGAADEPRMVRMVRIPNTPSDRHPDKFVCPTCGGYGDMESSDPEEQIRGIRETCYHCGSTGLVTDAFEEYAGC